MTSVAGRQGHDGVGRFGRRTDRRLHARGGSAARAAPVAGCQRRGDRGRDQIQRRPGQRTAADPEHPRRADRLQRELAEPRPAVAADDRPSVRQGHRRVHRHRARATTRSSPTGCWSRKSISPGALRRTHWKQSVPIASWLYALGMARFAVHHYDVVRGIPQQVWVFPQDRDKGYDIFELTGRRAFEFFSDWIGPYAYEKLAHVQAAGLGGGTEHASAIFYGEKGVAARTRARRPRGRAPVVGQRRHREGLGRCVAERGVRDLLHAPVHRAVRGPRRLRARAAGRHQHHRRRAEGCARSTRHPSQPLGHEQGAEPARLSEGRLGAAHAARHDRHGQVLDRHPRLLPPLSQPERIHRRLPPGDGTGVGHAALVVLRPVADAAGHADAARRLAIRCRRQSRCTSSSRRRRPARRSGFRSRSRIVQRGTASRASRRSS